ncbi:MAG: LVIVD repeat-containing protein [Candidatus Dormibacteria bacterium]
MSVTGKAMMARTGLLLGLAAAIVAIPGPAQAAVLPESGWQRAVDQLPAQAEMVARGKIPTRVQAATTPPVGSIAGNIQFISNLDIPTAIAIAFIGNTAFISTVHGLYSVDISDPTNPTILGAVPMYIWEDEHMQAIPSKNIVIVSRDPRGYTSPGTTIFPYGTLQIFDVSNPRAMVEVGTHFQPTGHTATCVNSDCTFVWVAGPAAPCIRVGSPIPDACISSPGAPGVIAPGPDTTWPGRPVWAVDISNPSSPVDCPNPHFIDLNSHNGKTDYDHDADVDANGVAWVAGSGHIRGYWTSGQHLNPFDGKVETATPCDPIEYAGANMLQGQFKDGGDMHNSNHNVTLSVDGRQGDVLAATEENTTTSCGTSGSFWTYDLQGAYGAAAAAQNTMYKILDRWGTNHQVGTSYPTGCDSAHWFQDRGDGLIAIAFYSQGTRILDIRDPRHIKQVGWYNVADQTGHTTNDSWAAYWHGDNYVYVADFTRGLDILKYSDTTAAGTSSSPPPGSGQSGYQRAGASLPNSSAARGIPWAAALLVLVASILTALLGRRREA